MINNEINCLAKNKPKITKFSVFLGKFVKCCSIGGKHLLTVSSYKCVNLLLNILQ